jgi:Tol biopolymer transport system component
LTGKLGFDNWIQNGQFTPWNAAIANVDGSDIRLLGEGNSAAFSPDGARVAFTSVSGTGPLAKSRFAITGLAGGAQTLLPDGLQGLAAMWSPDGKELAYMAGGSPFDLFVMDADGSNIRRVTHTPEDENLVGWLPDGSGLAFQQDGPGGSALWSLDLQTGARKKLFGPYRTIFSYTLSPDGRRVATNERLFGDNDDELYVYNLDGSGRRLVANLMPLMLSGPVWSPDSHWLAVTVTPPDQPGQINIPIIALLGLDTCQVIPLPGLQGNISAWGP